MKKFLYIAAMTLLLASCTEDYKDWAEPQSNPQGEVITFGNGSITPVGVIDFAEVTEERVKVCDIVAPSSNDTTFKSEPIILLNGQEFVLGLDGTLDADELQNFVTSTYGRAPEPRVLTAQVIWVMTNGVTSTTIKSAPFEVTVIPAPIAVPDLWYLVGSCIGDGSWGNDPANVGTALIPMYSDDVEDFSVLTYAGYFPAGQGFKLIHQPGNWDEQWGMKDGVMVKNDGNSSNIEVAEAGYYKLTYDMNTETLTMEPYTGEVGVYSMMGMPGGYQDWNPGGTLMNPMSTVAGVENHDWILKDATYSENTELKFAADGGWAVNWGSNTFPLGNGVQNGANIPVEAGTYNVVFNDLLGKYYFIKM